MPDVGQFGEQFEPARRALVVRRQPRFLAKTARDAGGFYPADGANVYPIIFLGGVYTETAGTQTPPSTERSADALAVAMNIAGDDHYIPEGTVLRVWRIGHRYYTYRKGTTGCVYESDDWDRVDDDDPGTIWTETAGDWDVLDGTLVTSDADAELTCGTLAPGGSVKYVGGVSIKCDTDGDVARMKIDGANYFAELERITSSCGRLRIYDDTGASSVCKGSVGVALSEWTQIVWCSEEDKIHVGTGGAPLLSLAATVASSEVALATGACTGTIAFDTLRLSKHYDDDATCPACGDEGCVWFSDTGCASGSLSATDYTIISGTWAYGYTTGVGSAGTLGNSVQCSASGELDIVPSHPLSSQKCRVTFRTMLRDVSYDTGATVKYYLDSGTTYLEIAREVGSPSPYAFKVRLWSGGVQFGATIDITLWAGSGWLVDTHLCWDGSTVTADVTVSYGWFGGSYNWFVGSATPTITTIAPRIVTSNLGHTLGFHITATKHADDVPGCPGCTTPSCAHCLSGTFANHATVTIADIISNAYGCTCTDQTIDLYATATGCQWTGTKTGPCSSGTWTATATITVVSGGYKLTVTVANYGASATFENTVLSGSPVDCLTAFDGDVPRVSASGGASPPCAFGSATCTFATP